jgi:hypothetical protein
MWINSPLGKWDQDVLVEKALRGAERRRMLEAGRGAWEGYRIGEFLRCSILRVARRVTPVMHQVADAL